jgi:hypothetical protein
VLVIDFSFECEHEHDYEEEDPWLLHDEHKEQLASPNLRSPDNQRTAFAQGRVGFEQQLTILKQLKIDPVAIVRNSARIDMKREMFAHGQPIGLTALQRFTRLTDHFELIVAEGALQGPIQLVHLGRRRLRLRRIGRDDQSTPDLLTGSRRPAAFPGRAGTGGRNVGEEDRDPGENGKNSAAHGSLRGVVARQGLEPIDPEHGDAILLRLEN